MRMGGTHKYARCCPAWCLVRAGLVWSGLQVRAGLRDQTLDARILAHPMQAALEQQQVRACAHGRRRAAWPTFLHA